MGKAFGSGSCGPCGVTCLHVSGECAHPVPRGPATATSLSTGPSLAPSAVPCCVPPPRPRAPPFPGGLHFTRAAPSSGVLFLHVSLWLAPSRPADLCWTVTLSEATSQAARWPAESRSPARHSNPRCLPRFPSQPLLGADSSWLSSIPQLYL